MDGADSANVTARPDATTGPDNSPAPVRDEESTPRFVMDAPEPSLRPPLAQRAAACANSTAFATAPEAMTPATSVVSTPPSSEWFALSAVDVPAAFRNCAAGPAIFAESTASASPDSPKSLLADSRSRDCAGPGPLRTESLPESAEPPESLVWVRNLTLFSATSEARRTAVLAASASFSARANDAEVFSAARADWDALKGTASDFDSLGTTVVITRSRLDT